MDRRSGEGAWDMQFGVVPGKPRRGASRATRQKDGHGWRGVYSVCICNFTLGFNLVLSVFLSLPNEG